jgi:hypothetical protein
VSEIASFIFFLFPRFADADYGKRVVRNWCTLWEKLLEIFAACQNLAKQHCSCDENCVCWTSNQKILNLSQLFRHFHGFIKGSPCPHRTHGTWDTTPIDPSPSRGRRPTPSVVQGAERAERSASGSNLVALMEPKLLVWDSRNHFYVEPHSR